MMLSVLLCRLKNCLLLLGGGEQDLHMGSRLTTKVVSIPLVQYHTCQYPLGPSHLSSAVPDKPHPDAQSTNNPKLKLLMEVCGIHMYALWFVIVFPAL